MLWLLEISCILFQGSRWEPLVWKLFGTTWCLSATCFIYWWSGTGPFVQFPFPSRHECFAYKDPRNNPEKSPLVWGKLGNRSSLFFHFILVCFIRSKQEWLPQLLFLPARKVFVGSPVLLLGGFLEPRGFFFKFKAKWNSSLSFGRNSLSSQNNKFSLASIHYSNGTYLIFCLKEIQEHTDQHSFTTGVAAAGWENGFCRVV